MKLSIARFRTRLSLLPVAAAAAVACGSGSTESIDTSSSAIWPIPIVTNPCWLEPEACAPFPTGTLLWARKISDAPGGASGQTASFGANGQLVIGGSFNGNEFTLGSVPPVPGIGIWSGAFVADLYASSGVADVSFQATSDYAGLGLAAGNGEMIFAFNYNDGIEATGTGQFTMGGSFGVAKLTPQGDVVALKTFGTATTHGDPMASVSALAQMPNGDLALTGSYWGTVPFGTQTLTSVNADSFVLELDSQLDLVSVHAAGGATNGASNSARALAIDGSGNIVVGGSADPDTTSLFGCPFPAGSPFASPTFFVSLSPSGHCDWLKRYNAGSTPQDTSVSSMAPAPEGGLVAGGTFTDVTSSQQTSFAGYVLSLDGNGNVRWVNEYPSTDWSQVNAVAVDRWGEVVVGGAFGGQVNLGKGQLSGTDDGFVLKATSGGKTLWNTTFAGTANGVAVDASGKIAVVGQFWSSTQVQRTTLTNPADAALVFELSP
jgi:hypothetical protein